MTGLDPNVIAAFSKDHAIGRILNDIRTDFIFAPQYKLLLDSIPDELWDEATGQLRSGTYNPSSLITAEVPKPSGMTRPGSILYPVDRLLYQAVGDHLAPLIDSQLDGTRVYSHRIAVPDPRFQMFDSRGASYEEYKQQVIQLCSEGNFTHAIVADISSYFAHLNHHTLENLLNAAGVPEGLVTLLVKTMLEMWSGRFSYGIPQGLFPSDLLGNFYLSALDAFLASRGTPSLRYVDDLVLFYPAEDVARSSLAPLCRFLRGIGLDLNESKSAILSVESLIREQTELDKLFEAARQEIYEQLQEADDVSAYGFQDPWEIEQEEELLQLEAESLALEQLWEQRADIKRPKRDQLDKFCLGAFAGNRSDVAVSTVIDELGRNPHLTRMYCNYLATFVRRNVEIQRALCRFLESDTCIYDWEMQWPIAALLGVRTLPQSTINTAVAILADRRRSNELRAACAILIAKFGSGASRTILRGHWDTEDSDHVRSAMVFGTMFFGEAERRVLLSHWGTQSPLLALIAKAVRKQLSAASPGR